MLNLKVDKYSRRNVRKQNLHNARASILPKLPDTFLELHKFFDNSRNLKQIKIKMIC